MGRTQEALADWNEAIRLKPDYFAAHAQRALIYLKLNELEKALPDLDAAVRLNPHPEDTYLQIQKQAVEETLKSRAARQR